MGVVDSDPRFQVSFMDNHGAQLDITWADGHRSTFHAVWLRHACQCEDCGTYLSAIRSLRLTEIPDDIELAKVEEHHGEVRIVWCGDSHKSRFPARWLRERCNSESERTRRRWRPVLWSKEIEARVPEADYDACKADDGARLVMLEKLRDHGFVLVRNVPDDPSATEDIAGLAGPLRITNYGSIYDFTYKPDALVYGDLNVALDPHTDEPYRQAPPSVTCFHFIRAAAKGGENTMTDGFRIGAILRDEDPVAFRLLATLPLTFYRRLEGQNRDFRMRAPVFSLDEDGEIAGIRHMDRSIGPADMADDMIRPFYRALRRLQSLLFNPAHQVRVPVGSGEALFFNNQRVLHGRAAFAADGDRYMRTCHVELDEFNSTLRTLAAHQDSESANLNLPHGALV
ncbi:MAG: TauD/TfdA family dioxygenase [Rhodospirillales bacterium]|nr:TauD/TfdA family dioxygenase [Rhodospirillales bacterium]